MLSPLATIRRRRPRARRSWAPPLLVLAAHHVREQVAVDHAARAVLARQRAAVEHALDDELHPQHALLARRLEQLIGDARQAVGEIQARALGEPAEDLLPRALLAFVALAGARLLLDDHRRQALLPH